MSGTERKFNLERIAEQIAPLLPHCTKRVGTGGTSKGIFENSLTDAIVKNMLLHSREGSGEHRVVDINALVEEGVNLRLARGAR